jgi:tRNA modification GTPase
VAELRTALATRLGGGPAEAALVSSQRHLEALRRAEAHLAHARQALEASTLEVVSGEVGLALDALHEVTGTDASATLLDAIFARFCIGK